MRIKGKNIICGTTSIIFLLAGVLLIINSDSKNASSDTESTANPFRMEIPKAPLMETLTVQEMTEDLDYLVKTIEEVHPSLMEGWSTEQQKVIADRYKQIQTPLTKDEFYFSVNQIASLVHDAHTSVSPLNSNTEALPLSVYWTQEGLVVLNSTLDLKRGDLLVKLGELTPEELLTKLTQVVPAENEYWVKTSGILMLSNRAFLNYLDLIENGKVSVTVEREGELVRLNVPLITPKYQKLQSPYDTGYKDYSYTFNEQLSLGILRINTCLVNQDYLNTLESFFFEVSSRQIKHVALDLRNNSGGDSRVIDELIRYIEGVRKYDSYSGLVRYSIQAAEQRGESQTSGYSYSDSAQIEIENPATPSFSGDLYALTSPLTFSSGNWFAVIIQDNQLGKIVGEPTGNQPSSYGDILSFSLPHSEFQFKRPNRELDDQTTLMPDITTYTTRQDIIEGRDSQISKLEEIIREKQ